MIESPCINVCRLDETGAACIGCRRTLTEIATWSGLTEKAKIEVMALIKTRETAPVFPFAHEPSR